MLQWIAAGAIFLVGLAALLIGGSSKSQKTADKWQVVPGSGVVHADAPAYFPEYNTGVDAQDFTGYACAGGLGDGDSADDGDGGSCGDS